MPTIERWHATWNGLGLTPAADLLEQLCGRYSEPHRAYHTLRHLEECFACFDPVRQLATQPSEVELALWFHSAVYDTRTNDSEARSAAWAEEALTAARAAAGQIASVTAMILASRHNGSHASGDRALFLDVDLSILGAPRERFLEYEVQVRQEYAWVPEPAFRSARRAILARFLERPRLYWTEPIADRLEATARANLQDSLTRLRP
jgi:predicted metal-dependent HD superfamily phosphohydrolase